MASSTGFLAHFFLCVKSKQNALRNLVTILPLLKLSKNILRLSSITMMILLQSDDDSYENIDYVDASPPDDEIISLEVVEIVIPEVGGIDTNILLT
ncbi:hypothetical protein Tco_0354501, partial [Tanacetum coccineum]